MKALGGSLAEIEHNRQLEAKLSAASSELTTVNAKRATRRRCTSCRPRARRQIEKLAKAEENGREQADEAETNSDAVSQTALGRLLGDPLRGR